MTTFDRIEPRLPELLDELAAATVPDYLDDLLRAAERAPQRPAWSAPERWLPMGTLARPSPITRFPWRPAVVVALVAMTLVAVGLIVSVGSRPAIPIPFGPAGNGALLYRDADGTIRTLDPETGRVASIAAPLARPGDPVPSRDGQRVAFLPADLGAGRIVVSDPDGTNAVTLAGDYHDVSQIDWSPDSGSLAIV